MFKKIFTVEKCVVKGFKEIKSKIDGEFQGYSLKFEILTASSKPFIQFFYITISMPFYKECIEKLEQSYSEKKYVNLVGEIFVCTTKPEEFYTDKVSYYINKVNLGDSYELEAQIKKIHIIPELE